MWRQRITKSGVLSQRLKWTSRGWVQFYLLAGEAYTRRTDKQKLVPFFFIFRVQLIYV